jgi:hypothetical protein
MSAIENGDAQPTPQNIMQIDTSFWASKILLSAVRFELFTLLEENKKMTAKEIKESLNFNCMERHVYDYLDALTGFGFLTREGILESAHYSNSVDAAFFLDKGKQTYIGGLLEMFNNRIYHQWETLEDGLLTGLPQRGLKDLFNSLYESPDSMHEFVNAMSGFQMANFMNFVQTFDFSGYKTLVDVGGSSGLLSGMVAKQQPHMTCCTTFDLPPIKPIAEATIEKFNVGDRVKAASGDFFIDKFPAADVVVMGNILHDWDEETKLMLLKKAYDALPDGGAFVAIECVIDEDRKQNVFGLMMSLQMLMETGSGFDYTFDDFNNWAKIAGFKSTTILALAGPTSAAVAYK